MVSFLIDRLKLVAQKRSSLKCFLNFLWVSAARSLGLSTAAKYPFLLILEPTNLCNLHCPTCPTGSGRLKRKKGTMSFELFKKIIDEVGDYLFTIISYPDFVELAEKYLPRGIEETRRNRGDQLF